ncbi:MAG: DUF922 domain-containing protein [Ferruginibacter sp.]
MLVNYVANDDKSNSNNINYQPGALLSWSDFKGRPVEGSDAAAITSAGFGVKLSFKRLGNTAELLIAVNCSFSKKDSWVKPNHKTSYILNHEQRHFDVAFIHTLRFIERLQNAKYTAANYPSVIEKIYKETALEMAQMQNEYDSQSDHSRNTDRQTEWNQKIGKLLSSASLAKQ